MRGQKVIPLGANRRAPAAGVEDGVAAMLVFVISSAMMFTGMVTTFLLTRAVAGDAWPPAGQPWFPPGETSVNTVALLASGALVFRAARAWRNREAALGPLLLAAIALGAFFVFFQGVLWVLLIREGLTLISSFHGTFFCLIMGMHGAHALGALAFLGAVWLRLKPLRDDPPARGSVTSSTFSAACILWYFVVGIWPVLCLCLYL